MSYSITEDYVGSMNDKSAGGYGDNASGARIVAWIHGIISLNIIDSSPA